MPIPAAPENVIAQVCKFAKQEPPPLSAQRSYLMEGQAAPWMTLPNQGCLKLALLFAGTALMTSDACFTSVLIL